MAKLAHPNSPPNLLIEDQPVQIVICPGIHPPALTRQFVQAISLPKAWIYPAPTAPAYSAVQILAFLRARTGLETPLLLIGFSAGVVGAATAADLWQALGGRVVALLAFDGWGMPLRSRFPVHRFSHDPFTHWSSALLDGAVVQPIRFYADPPVGHLNLWRAPQMTQGWAVSAQADPRPGSSGHGSSGHDSSCYSSSQAHYRRSNAAELVRQIIANYSPDQIA